MAKHIDLLVVPENEPNAFIIHVSVRVPRVLLGGDETE